jgi:hypothetical protein
MCHRVFAKKVYTVQYKKEFLCIKGIEDQALVGVWVGIRKEGRKREGLIIWKLWVEWVCLLNGRKNNQGQGSGERQTVLLRRSHNGDDLE